MKSYQWWKKQKKRVQKKYTSFLGQYLSPKESRKWHNHWTSRHNHWTGQKVRDKE